MSYIRDTARGVAWIGAFRGVTRLVSLGKTVLLARVLTPGQFGVFGVAALTLSLLEVLTETGINTVLIQRADDADEYIDSAWVISILRGGMIAAIMSASAAFVAAFFNVPESTRLILLASLIPLVRGFINPAAVKFQKDLRFKQEFLYRTSVFLIDATVSIILALKTQNPESLVWGILAGATAEMVLSHIVVGPRPRLLFEKAKLKFIVSRGKWMTATGILDYFIQNGDNIIVGRVLGASSLGLYQMTYQISTAPVGEISNILSKVTFPIFMKIAHERDRMFSAYLRVAASIGGVVGIIALGLFLLATPFVQLLLGETWLSVVPTLRILAVFAFVKSIVLSSYALFLAQGKQERVTVVSLTGFLGMFAVILPLVNQSGINGAAYAALFGAIISLVPVVYYVRKS